ncbi:MAG: hypothetical protein WC504_00640 [Methylobacter sp.]|jgi:hypothetical protein
MIKGEPIGSCIVENKHEISIAAIYGLRAVNVAADAGVFALLVHALSDHAKQFYLSRGFVESPLQPMTLFTTIETARSILADLD